MTNFKTLLSNLNTSQPQGKTAQSKPQDNLEKTDIGRWSDLYSSGTKDLQRWLMNCQDTIQMIDTGEVLVVMTNKNWTMEILLCHIGEQLGQVDAWIACWSVGDAAVQRLGQAKSRGFIRNLRWVVDERMKAWKPHLWDLVLGVAGKENVGRSKCHAKMYVLKQVEGDRVISIVGSANFNKTPKQEGMVIMTDPRAGQFIIDWIEEQI